MKNGLHFRARRRLLSGYAFCSYAGWKPVSYQPGATPQVIKLDIHVALKARKKKL